MNSNPYDRFFRAAFQGRDEAKGLTHNILPAEHLKKIDLDTIEVLSESLVEPGMRDRYSDLLLRFRPVGKSISGKQDKSDSKGVTVSGGRNDSNTADIFVYCLYEHKSYRDRLAPVQLLGYVLRIWNKYRKGTHLPEVIPVLFYHGLERWNRAKTVQDLFTAKGPHIPTFEPIFVDLRRMDTARFHGTARVLLSLLFLKYIKNRFTEEIVRLLLRVVVTLPPGDPILKLFYSTLFDTKSDEEVYLFQEAAKMANYKAIREEMMTYSQARILEGERIGKKKGEIKGKQETLIRQIDRKYGIVDEEKELIMSIHDPDILDSALDEFAVSDEKGAVLGRLK